MRRRGFFDLTMPSRARSNTALFHSQGSHEAHLPTVQDAPRTPARISRAQPNAWRACGIAQPARARPSAARAVIAVAHARKRFGLDAGRRLRLKAQFERLLREGERRNLGGFTFYLIRRGSGVPCLGILISRKHAAAAVERNRIKRCIREAFRLEQENLAGLELLIRPPLGMRPASDAVARLRALLRRLTA
jgi:ribonuclease P protein component